MPKPKPSKQPTHFGIVVSAVFTEDNGYGFIRPDDSDGSREKNVWFGRHALQGAEAKRGDRVRYILFSETRPGKGRAADRLWIIADDSANESVTTLHGEFET